MEATKYTPGPWAATPSDPAEGVECIWITACPAPNQEKEIAAVYGPQNERNKATAALIRAAPDLVEALKGLLSECVEYARINNIHNSDGSPATNHAMRRARAAISRASR